MRKPSTMPRKWLCCFFLLLVPLPAQKPIISPGGVVNAASLVPVDQPAHGVAPGSIASIFGQNLASAAASAQGYPLPLKLNGTSVTVDGVAAPLFYVSPTQINFQVPSSAGAPLYGEVYSKVAVVVATPGGTSDPAAVDMYYKGFGIFTLDGSGCGRGAVLDVSSDGTTSLNSPSNSASPGSYLTFFGTGLGPVYNPPPDGAVEPSQPLSPSTVFPPVPGFFAGRAPGMVGVDQVNIVTSAAWQEGCAVPLGMGLSNLVAVSIHSGGGQCVDGPSNSLGQVLLKRSVVLNDSTVPESDTLLASFSASPYQQLASPPVNSSDLLAAQATAVCPPPGYAMLDAGGINLAGPVAFKAQAQPSAVRGNLSYRLQLPPGSVQPGTFVISSPGGKDVGPFQTSLQVPAGIQITSSFPKGTIIYNTGTFLSLKPLTVSWTGGAAGQVVTVKAIDHWAGDGDYVETVFQGPATAGSASSGRSCIETIATNVCTLGLHGAPDAELVVELGPDPTALPAFSAPGLTLGGLAGWAYEYRFPGLSVQ